MLLLVATCIMFGEDVLGSLDGFAIPRNDVLADITHDSDVLASLTGGGDSALVDNVLDGLPERWQSRRRNVLVPLRGRCRGTDSIGKVRPIASLRKSRSRLVRQAAKLTKCVARATRGAARSRRCYPRSAGSATAATPANSEQPAEGGRIQIQNSQAKAAEMNRLGHVGITLASACLPGRLALSHIGTVAQNLVGGDFGNGIHGCVLNQ